MIKLRKNMIRVLIGVLLCAGINQWYSYQCLQVTVYEIETEKISSPVRLVLLSDLHDNQIGLQNEKLVEYVRLQNPDFILMAGDMLNRGSKDSTVAVKLIEDLKVIAPVYFSWGNHELGYLRSGTSDLEREVTEAGAVLLDGQFSDVDINGNRLRIGGFYIYRLDKLEDESHVFLTDFVDTNAYTLMMSHVPDCFIFGEGYKDWEIDLAVSGHYHNGQIVLPVLGGIWGGDQGLFPQYCAGRYEREELKLIIGAGLGSQPYKVPRINNPPEIVVIDLLPTKGQP